MTGLWTMKEYIRRWHDTIEDYIMNHPIYELCTGMECIPGLIRFLLWWVQDLTREEEENGASDVAEREVR